MRVARWRWVLVQMVVVVAGCLPHPPLDLPPSFLSDYDGTSGPRFTAQTPPTGATGQDVVALLRADRDSPMFRGRAVPVFGVMDCHGDPQCARDYGGQLGTVWVVLYPDCTDAAGDFGWVLVDAELGLNNGYSWTAPCAPNG
jgi:hypothetical protein